MESIRDLFEYPIGGLAAGIIIVRIFLSFVAGFVMGLEREIHQHPAGLRTIIMISVSSTLLMMLSMMIPGTGDPSRIAAQVVSGIGFLGGGAILRQGMNIRGLTSAAIIWAAAAMGLAIGAGLYLPSAISLLVYIITLILLEKLEVQIFSSDQRKFLDIEFNGTEVCIDTVKENLNKHGITIHNTDITCRIPESRILLSFSIKVSREINFKQLADNIQTCGSVRHISLHG